MSEKHGALTPREAYEEQILSYREKGYVLLKKMDACLQEKTEESVIEFVRIFEEPRMEHYILAVTELAYADVLRLITLDEVEKSQKVQFLLNGNSLKELMAVIKKIEFAMWEVEFESGTEAEEKLYERMQCYHVSPEAINQIILAAAIDKRKIYYTLSCIYLEHQEIDSAIRLLELAQRVIPDDPELLQCFEMLCERRGVRGDSMA